MEYINEEKENKLIKSQKLNSDYKIYMRDFNTFFSQKCKYMSEEIFNLFPEPQDLDIYL